VLVRASFIGSMVTAEVSEASERALTPLVVVTADSHVGPHPDHVRPYCPSKYVADFDAFVRSFEDFVGNPELTAPREGHDHPSAVALRGLKSRMLISAGHYDVSVRIDEMNRDGVAAEVIFHGSSNGQLFPFIPVPRPVHNRSTRNGGEKFALRNPSFFYSPTGSRQELELLAVGQQMYNRWLADLCSVEPERHVGLAHVSMWDPPAAVNEIEQAREMGLRGVNFPSPRPGIPLYDDPVWEPFWSACESLGMVLTTHGGAGDPSTFIGRHAPLIARLESGYDKCRGALPRLIFGGVFERHPELKLVYTELIEQPSSWWPATVLEYDLLYRRGGWTIDGLLTKPPSEYLRDNVFIGASLLHRKPEEASVAVHEGYAANMMWGSDYPHIEGTVLYPQSDDDVVSTTRLSLSHDFAGLPADDVQAMVGETAARVYGLDVDRLAYVARRIEAPTLTHIDTKPTWVPEFWELGPD